MRLGATLTWLAILVVYRKHGEIAMAIRVFRDNLMAHREQQVFALSSAVNGLTSGLLMRTVAAGGDNPPFCFTRLHQYRGGL